MTVTGVNDAVADGTQSYTIATAAAVSGDGDYSGLDAADATGTTTDDDAAGIIVDPDLRADDGSRGGRPRPHCHLHGQTRLRSRRPMPSVGLSSSDITAGHGQSGDAHLHQRQLDPWIDGDRHPASTMPSPTVTSELHHRHPPRPSAVTATTAGWTPPT